ncbi:unnamed protein product [Penicillium manginii]
MSTLIAPLGSVIGYLGASAATESFFERLLWPQRFYNDADLYVLLRIAFCLPMSGPLHGAALNALDTFRENGLYLGIRRGDMLGTTFYGNLKARYYHQTTSDVLREVKCQNHNANLAAPTPEDLATDRVSPYRAMQLVHHLKLHYAKDTTHAGHDAVEITEVDVHWRTVLGTVLSEFSSIVVAIIAAVAKPFRTYWLSGFFLIPLALKFLALFTSVRRESIIDIEEKFVGHGQPKDELYKIEDSSHGFAIIQGPSNVFLQFCRHYGHPTRDNGAAGRRDRAKELLSICLIYLFMLYFPVGLIGSLWMPDSSQLLWLGFQDRGACREASRTEETSVAAASKWTGDNCQLGNYSRSKRR